ncbi:unnamed protein product [Peronospora belbahrii]|uniref:WRKY transcription factor 19 n=1 Tax=Peronospora belbahrii TaxID=622444 RepID=A0AAU9LK80_9STRA|nr:unnamed protein product [Peronospora belbahrii]
MALEVDSFVHLRPDAVAHTDTNHKDVNTKDQTKHTTHHVYEMTESSSDESLYETSSSDSNRMMSDTIKSDADTEVTLTANDKAIEKKEEEEEEEEKKKKMAQTMDTNVYISEREEHYNTKNVADMHYLFTNDKLKDEPPAVVLKLDPFCIPRVTDNVPNYRPMLNPLSIFLGEDQLLPGNFRLDPLERPPNACGKAAKLEDKNEPNGILPLPGSSSSISSTGKQFCAKNSTFMGTMPRQTEFAETQVSNKRFQHDGLFCPLPPILRVPPPASKDDRSTRMNRKSGNKLLASSSHNGEDASTLFTGDSIATPASLSDAMLLSSIQHTLDITTATLVATSGTMPSEDSATENASSLAEGSSTCQIQPLEPLDSATATLTNFLPTSRSSSRLNSSKSLNEQQFDAIGGKNPVNILTSYSVGDPGASDSSPVEHQTSTPYASLFIDSSQGRPTDLTMQTFFSALGSIFITTPTTTAAGKSAGLIMLPGRSNEGVPRRPGARKPRAKNIIRPCTSPGCTKGARGKSGLCQKHGGGKRCATPNCPKGAQGSSAMCLFHGGGYRCTVEWCSTGARGTSGLCAKHGGYKKGKAGKRKPIERSAAVKRIRTNDSQASPAAVNAA